MMKTCPENLKRPADLALDLDTLSQDLDYFHELIFVDELARHCDTPMQQWSTMINMVHLKHKDKQEAKTVVKLGVLSVLIISYLPIICLFTCCVDFRDALLRKMRKRRSPVGTHRGAKLGGWDGRFKIQQTSTKVTDMSDLNKTLQPLN